MTACGDLSQWHNGLSGATWEMRVAAHRVLLGGWIVMHIGVLAHSLEGAADCVRGMARQAL